MNLLTDALKMIYFDNYQHLMFREKKHKMIKLLGEHVKKKVLSIFFLLIVFIFNICFILEQLCMSVQSFCMFVLFVCEFCFNILYYCFFYYSSFSSHFKNHALLFLFVFFFNVFEKKHKNFTCYMNIGIQTNLEYYSIKFTRYFYSDRMQEQKISALVIFHRRLKRIAIQFNKTRAFHSLLFVRLLIVKYKFSRYMYDRAPCGTIYSSNIVYKK